uniref:Lateral organ boundaries domain protein n=1 Tax=Boehmeria nivea TaxID=83906 RepID=A0A172J1X6_BOENI|nr:lateral organ boundaries domain protein [Boehmeria nivea]
MSCNGCRVLRKGCSETCILRPCLQWIESAESQGHATVFVAKFFGRAGLMSFISAVPDSQRPALFQSLLFEACGRTVNPVNGAVGLLWTGNWHVCQAAVETVLRGGALRPMPELLASGGGGAGGGGRASPSSADEASEAEVTCAASSRFSASRPKRKRCGGGGGEEAERKISGADLDLRLTPVGFPAKKGELRRPGSPSTMNSEESTTTTMTTCLESVAAENLHRHGSGGERKLLNLFF